MRHAQEFARLGTYRHIDRVLMSVPDPGQRHFFGLISLMMRAEALLADVAPFVRLGSGMVIDVRLDEDRQPLRRRRLGRAA